MLLLALFGCALVGAEPRRVRDETNRVFREVYLMGTRATLVVATADRPAGLAQLERTLQLLETTERELSTWRDDSLLSQLNRHPLGLPWAAPDPICRWLAAVAHWHERTDGAFDPAVGALTPPVGLGRGPIGFAHLTFDPVACTVTRRQNVMLDAGGFGKGAALDRVSRALSGDAAPWMIDLGGQVAVSGEPRGGPWTVALADPRNRAHTVHELELREGSIAVSGGSERDRWVDGVRVGHIVDPRVGRPVDSTSSVIVWHRQALVADMLSTALYVMGEDAGLVWAARHDVAACFISPPRVGASPDGDVTLRASRAFRRQFALP